jgi:lipoprotein-anchoring transpeptidase ErfK/SrfK
MSSAHNGDLRLPYMTRFTVARSGLAIGFHGIPLRRNGSPIQNDSELGEFRSAGCVRMNQNDIRTLWNWAPIGTPVVVLR